MPLMPSAGLRARVALDRHDFRTSHALGQNFLLDDALLSHLLDLADVSAQDNVLEIGPGAGVMTALLAGRAQRVLAVEVDERLQPVLESVLAPHENASVRYADFLKCDVGALVDGAFGGAPYRVVANLPYYITADILLRLTTCARRPERIDIMVQREAAERILSNPGCKQWCALAAIVRHYGAARVLEDVPAAAFEPPPHVESCFLEIARYAEPPVRPADEAAFLRTIHAAFALRRKTLANNLNSACGLSAQQAADVLARAGIDGRVRGEALSLEELARVSDALQEAKY